ncbi:hypothetical protein [Stakelama tenebrarum]|uniref:O-antigen ligase domain-containing protein n=1 Tax=Stakelama tenebrarum TaxID=2711215 RepID=A0A6G6Y3P2_9SPHN|nr:hypothetical protein [Sphingosinithalassobacter tenebrarum]QIG79535.1 hypothetical protein G5C33_06860 [Sphingosinithalassobacter tenebrarum]
MTPSHMRTGTTMGGARRKPGNLLIYTGFILLVLFNIGMPKGGIAYGGSPLTFGYLLFAALAPVALVGMVGLRNISPVAITHMMFGFIPIAALAIFKLMGEGAMFALLIYTVLFAILPALMLVIYAPYLEALTDEQIGVALKWILRFVVVWGIFNFILFAVSRNFIEIPYLTVNPLDSGEIYSKNNRRGFLMKLVSTYNNGNIYGVCMAMLGPIYFRFEKSKFFIAAFCAAIILSLSRTAWFALVAMTAGMILVGQLRLVRWQFWLGGLAVIALIIILLPMMGWTTERIYDAQLGGRMLQWEQLEFTLFGGDDVRISEVLYAGIFQSFGMLGSITALVALFFPVGFGVMNLARLSPLRRSALVGVVAYLLAAASDAAFIYPPVMLIFLFVTVMVYRRGYVGAASPARADVPRLPHYGPVPLSQAAGLVR